VNVTAACLLGIIVLLLVLEAWRVVKRDNSTISETVWRVTMRSPWLAFLAGFLAGHLLWASNRTYRALECEGRGGQMQCIGGK
jgi:ABC-type Fe3+ transport system permease subunit